MNEEAVVETLSFVQVSMKNEKQLGDEAKNITFDYIIQCFKDIQHLEEFDSKIFIALTQTVTVFLNIVGKLYDDDPSKLFDDFEKKDDSIIQNEAYKMFKRRFLMNRSILKTMSTRRIEGGSLYRGGGRGRDSRGRNKRNGRRDRRRRQRQRSKRQVGGMKWRHLLYWVLLAIQTLKAASFTAFTVEAIVGQSDHLKENLLDQFFQQKKARFDRLNARHRSLMTTLVKDYLSVVDNVDGHCAYNSAMMMNYPIQEVGNVMQTRSKESNGFLGISCQEMHEKLYKGVCLDKIEPSQNQDALFLEVGKEVYSNYTKSMSMIGPHSLDPDAIIAFQLSIFRHAVIGLVRKRQFSPTDVRYLVGIMDINYIEDIFLDAISDLNHMRRQKRTRMNSFIRVPPDFFDESDRQRLDIQTTTTPMQDILDAAQRPSFFRYEGRKIGDPIQPAIPLQTVFQLYNISHVEANRFTGILDEAHNLRMMKGVEDLNRKMHMRKSLSLGISLVSLVSLYDIMRNPEEYVTILPEKLSPSKFQRREILPNSEIIYIVNDEQNNQKQWEKLILSEHTLACVHQDPVCEQRLVFNNGQSFVSHQGKWVDERDSLDVDGNDTIYFVMRSS